MKPGTLKCERSQAILRAAIEAQAVRMDELTIVIVIDKTATIDIASSAPNERAAGLVPETLVLALDAVRGCMPDLAERIPMGKS